MKGLTLCVSVDNGLGWFLHWALLLQYKRLRVKDIKYNLCITNCISVEIITVTYKAQHVRRVWLCGARFLLL